MTTKFERDIASLLIEEKEDTRIHHIDLPSSWNVVNGPNGGYLAAVTLRAFMTFFEGKAPPRHPRLLTLNYMRPPQKGRAEIKMRLIREGRRVSTLTAEIYQKGKIYILAHASFSVDQNEDFSFSNALFPKVPPSEECPPMPPFIPAHQNYEMRPAFDILPFSGAEEALSGGWIRLAEPEKHVSFPLLAALTDAWPPSTFSLAGEGEEVPGAPTMELTIHFMRNLENLSIQGTDFLLARFHADSAGEGFFTEDGRIWSAAGDLLVESRQIGLVTKR